MRIGFMDYNGLDSGGGTEFWLSIVVPWLATRHQIQILAGGNSAGNTSLTQDLRGAGVRVTELRYVGPSTLPDLHSFQAIMKFFREQDVVYYIWSPGGLEISCLLAAKLTGVPVVMGHHQPVNWGEFEGSLSATQRIFYKAFGFRGRRLLRLSSIHHVINHRAQVDLISLKVRDVRCIPYCVDIPKFGPGPKFRDFTLLYLGRLEEQKGADRLPTIFHRVAIAAPDVRFVVAGSGTLGPLLERELRGINCELVGFVQGRLKASLLRQSHALIVPSRYESFALVGLEALASGTPVVSLRLPGLEDYLVEGKNGFLAKDLDTLVESILFLRRLWQSGKEYDEFVKQASESARAYSLESVMSELEQMLVQSGATRASKRWRLAVPRTD